MQALNQVHLEASATDLCELVVEIDLGQDFVLSHQKDRDFVVDNVSIQAMRLSVLVGCFDDAVAGKKLATNTVALASLAMPHAEYLRTFLFPDVIISLVNIDD